MIKRKLNERQAYIFEILKREELGNSSFYILKDPFGTKHIMPAEYYDSYNLITGSKIKCYIDKINCRGKIFLEPDHPYYKIHGIYDFKYSRKGTVINKKGKEFKVIFVNDIFNRKFTVLPNNKFQFSEKYKPETISCELKRIKKGKLYLVSLDGNNEINKNDI